MSKFAELNDKLRKNMFNPGKNKVVITSGVATLSLIDRMCLLKKLLILITLMLQIIHINNMILVVYNTKASIISLTIMI